MLDTSSKTSKYQVEDFAGKIESFGCCCYFCFFVFSIKGQGWGREHRPPELKYKLFYGVA